MSRSQPGDPGQQRGDSDDGGAAEKAAAHAARRRGRGGVMGRQCRDGCRRGRSAGAMVAGSALRLTVADGESGFGIRPRPIRLPWRAHRQNSRLFFGVPTSVANIKSAEKRARQTIKRRARNVAARSKLRTAIKDVVSAVAAGNKEEAAAKPEGSRPDHRLGGQQGPHPPQQGLPAQEPPERARQGTVGRLIAAQLESEKSRAMPGFFMPATRRGSALAASLGAISSSRVMSRLAQLAPCPAAPAPRSGTPAPSSAAAARCPCSASPPHRPAADRACSAPASALSWRDRR